MQNSTVQAMVAITQAADNLVTFSRSGKMEVADTLTALVDGLALLGNATQELNQRRRDGHRSDLNAQYKGLCNSDATGTGLLYGDDLHNRIKAIGETNRLSSKLATSVVISQAMCLTYSAMLKDRDYDVTAHIFLILSLKLTQNARGGRRRFAR